MSASTTVESTRIARAEKRLSRTDASTSTRVISSMTSGPKRPTSLRTVDSCGTDAVNDSPTNRRRCSESETSRTSVS